MCIKWEAEEGEAVDHTILEKPLGPVSVLADVINARQSEPAVRIQRRSEYTISSMLPVTSSGLFTKLSITT